jgi:hypothetical protein
MTPSRYLGTLTVSAVMLLSSWSAVAQRDTNDAHAVFESVAVARGWVTNYTRGREIIRELSALSPEQGRKLKVDAYRREKVAFVGVDAPPGVGDRWTENGFYLRVIYRKGKEPPKRSYIWSESMLQGTILQVHATNKIIVIEVDEEQIIQTG